jgi:hypothetical protein
MRIWVLAALAAGCAGDEPPGSGRCPGVIYDLCVEEHDCSTNKCINFPEFQVCSQACDDATPCPDGATCDNGFCKPAAPNDCTL